jgi:hypothetical protein
MTEFSSGVKCSAERLREAHATRMVSGRAPCLATPWAWSACPTWIWKLTALAVTVDIALEKQNLNAPAAVAAVGRAASGRCAITRTRGQRNQVEARLRLALLLVDNQALGIVHLHVDVEEASGRDVERSLDL